MKDIILTLVLFAKLVIITFALLTGAVIIKDAFPRVDTEQL